ncbi:MAG: hypothetical protein BWK78_07630 [Thiotrichaceae bacterium IS1]|nr:MAG: hypothetical protein BWK78_07630 [Thiotrichaceae bacterium IS1]
MLTQTLDFLEAQTKFPEILSLVRTGTEVILAQNNQPLIRLLPLSPWTESPPATGELSPRVLGLHEGEGWISDDFNAPLPDHFWLREE